MRPGRGRKQLNPRLNMKMSRMPYDHDTCGLNSSIDSETGSTPGRPSGCILIPVILLCVLYLLNPAAGFFEIIPDNFPIIGNLDEAGAVLLLIKCFSYYGVNLKWLISDSGKK